MKPRNIIVINNVYEIRFAWFPVRTNKGWRWLCRLRRFYHPTEDAVDFGRCLRYRTFPEPSRLAEEIAQMRKAE